MALWAVSLMAYREKEIGQWEFRHSAGYSTAPTEAEALGQAMLRARRLYPPKRGWTGHTVQHGRVPEADIRAALAGDSP